MGIFLLNPPEPQCNPTSTSEGRSQPDNARSFQNDLLHSGTCGRCRCVPRYYKLTASGSGQFSGLNILERLRYPDVGLTPAALDHLGACVWRSITYPADGNDDPDRKFWFLRSRAILPGSANNAEGWAAMLLSGISFTSPSHFFPLWYNGPDYYWRCLGQNTLEKSFDDGFGAGIGSVDVEPWYP